MLTRRPRSAFERGRALWWPHRLDVDALDACAAALVGMHDFTAFTPTQTEHVRFSREVFAAYWRGRPTDVLEFWIEADAFMRHMNRVLVGTMLEVGGGRRSVASFVALLAGRPRSAAGRDGAGRMGCIWRGWGTVASGCCPVVAARTRCVAVAARTRCGAIAAGRDAPATTCHASATTSSQLCN